MFTETHDQLMITYEYIDTRSDWRTTLNPGFLLVHNPHQNEKFYRKEIHFKKIKILHRGKN